MEGDVQWVVPETSLSPMCLFNVLPSLLRYLETKAEVQFFYVMLLMLPSKYFFLIRFGVFLVFVLILASVMLLVHVVLSQPWLQKAMYQVFCSMDFAQDYREGVLVICLFHSLFYTIRSKSVLLYFHKR